MFWCEFSLGGWLHAAYSVNITLISADLRTDVTKS